MADRYWNGGVDADWNDVNNWSDTDGGATPATSVPGTGDHAHFTVNGDGNPCTLDINITLGDLTILVGYTSKIDLGIKNLTMDDGGNVTLDGGGEFDCGTGSHSLTNGIFDNVHQSAWTYGTSTWTFNGTCTIKGHSSNDFYDLTFAVGSTVTIHWETFTRIDVRHTCTINGAVVLYDVLAVIQDGDFVINEGASFSGTPGWYLYLLASTSGHGLTTLHPSVNMYHTHVYGGAADKRLAAGTWTGLLKLRAIGTASATLQLDNATYNFNGGLELENTGTGTVTLDNKAHTPAINIGGDLIIDNDHADGTIVIDDTGAAVNWNITGDVLDEVSAGTFTYNKGSGAITASGSGNQDWDWMGQAIEDVEIDKVAGTLTFSGGVTMDSFTGTAGAFDPNSQTITTVGNFTTAAGFQSTNAADVMNGCTITVGGNLSLTGQSGTLLRLLATAGWTLTVTGTAAASYVEVEHCDASAGTEVNAPLTCTNGGNNTHWSFGNPMYYYQHLSLGAAA